MNFGSFNEGHPQEDYMLAECYPASSSHASYDQDLRCDYCGSHEAYLTDDVDAPFDTDTEEDDEHDHLYHNWLSEKRQEGWEDNHLANVLAHSYSSGEAALQKLLQEGADEIQELQTALQSPGKRRKE